MTEIPVPKTPRLPPPPQPLALSDSAARSCTSRRRSPTKRRVASPNVGGMRVIATDERDGLSGRLPTESWELAAEDWRRQDP